MDRAKRFIITLMVATIVLTSVAAIITPLSAGAGNASKTAAVTSPTAWKGNASTTAAVKTAPIVGAGTWHIQTVDSAVNAVGYYTSLQLTPTGWPAISYYDWGYGDLKYTYKDASGWHTQTVDSGGDVGGWSSLQLTSTGWPAISYQDSGNGDLKYAYKSAS
jgi:hypothetical protein